MKTMSLLQGFVTPFKDFSFPPLCFSCNERLNLRESRVCDSCWKSIRLVKGDDYTVRILRERFSAEGFIDEFYSRYYFEERGVFQNLVHSLKYEAMTVFGIELGMHLGEQLIEEIDVGRIDVIIPIPLHKMKMRERGYNQSESICKGISQVTARPVDIDVLQRCKNTVSQTHLTAEERKNNVGDAFAVAEGKEGSLAGSTILVIDDVMTTGSTIESAAKLLKRSGAAKVIAASAALAMLGGGEPAR
jgi:ComF family protein